MGMYDRDPNFEEHFEVGDRFVVTGMEYVGTINTRFGEAHKTLITIVTRDSYPKRVTYSVIGAGFANLAQRADRADFPHVAEYVRVQLDARRDVKRLARVDVEPRDWKDGDDGPPVDVDALTPASSGVGAAEDDIPF